MQNICSVPSINIRERGILTVFRSGVEPLWEDPANNRGSIIRFLMWKDEFSSDEMEQLRDCKIAPVVKDQQSIFLAVLGSVLTGCLWEEKEVNGIFFKTEKGITTLELWAKRREFASEISPKLIKLLDSFDCNYEYQIKGVPRKVNLSSTINITLV